LSAVDVLEGFEVILLEQT